MTRHTFTAGPWSVGGLLGALADERAIETPDGIVVGTAWQISPDYDIPEESPVREANARLLAAAPKLLTALLDTMRALEAHVNAEARLAAVDPAIVCPCPTHELHQAREVIGLATGVPYRREDYERNRPAGVELSNQQRNTVLAALAHYHATQQGEPTRRTDAVHDLACGERCEGRRVRTLRPDVSLDQEGTKELFDLLLAYPTVTATKGASS